MNSVAFVDDVMVNEGMSIALLKHELIENHDSHNQKHHPTEEMT